MVPDNFREQCDLALEKSKKLNDSVIAILNSELDQLKKMTGHKTFLLDFKPLLSRKTKYKPSVLFWHIASHFNKYKTDLVAELAMVTKLLIQLHNLKPYSNEDDLLQLHMMLYIYQQDKGKANTMFN